jgi:hypothetical protein
VETEGGGELEARQENDVADKATVFGEAVSLVFFQTSQVFQ